MASSPCRRARLGQTSQGRHRSSRRRRGVQGMKEHPPSLHVHPKRLCMFSLTATP